MSRATDTVVSEYGSATSGPGATSLFEAEVRAQVDRAAADLRRAAAAGDSSAEETAAARLADLRELHQRHHEPRRVLA